MCNKWHLIDDKRIVEDYTNRLTHFVHFFDDISRVYLDNNNSLEL